jgi:Rod binding domain-containing protein
MLDDEMSTKISEAGGIGIADLLYKNLMNAYNIGETDSSDDSETEGEAGSAATGAGLNLLG